MNVDGFKIDKNKKVGRKISALQGVTAYMNIVQKHVLMIFTLQFNYFPDSNVQILATEMYKFINNPSPTIRIEFQTE